MDQNPAEPDKRNSKHRRTFLLLSTLFFLFMVAVSVFRDKGFLKVMEAEAELENLKERIRLISFENERFTQEIIALKTHQTYYVERVAREELGLIKSDEIVYEFIDEDRFWTK